MVTDNSGAEASFEGGGLVLFPSVRPAIAAHQALKTAGHAARLVAPPAEMRKGCDLAVEVNLVEKPGIERLLREKDIPFLGLQPLKSDATELIHLVKLTDFGRWLMVKAGNMKLTYDKTSGVIVNTSGGGCPDIPYLNSVMVGRPLAEAPRPERVGYTLCALMLEQAFAEAQARFGEGDKP